MAAFDGLILLLAFAVAAALTPLVRDVARRHGLVDHALTSRKVHAGPIPRLGGVAIVLAFYAAALVALMSPAFRGALGGDFGEGVVQTGAFLAGGVAIFLLGLYDDLKGAGAKQKFTVQFAVAGLAYAAGFRIELVANPFGEPIALGWTSLPLTALWIAGTINALNLIDGLDGLAAGIALAGAGMILAVSAQTGQLLAMVSAAALIGAVAGFVVYNFSPASIFMGDTGSMFLGYVLATSAIQPDRQTGEVALLAFVVALGIPIADTLAAIARRASRGVPLFAADREHIHHRLLGLGLSARQTCLTLWALAALLAGAGAALAGCDPAALLVAIVVASALGVSQLGGWWLDDPGALLARRRRNVARQRVIREAGVRLRRARRVADLVEPLKDVGPALGATSISIHLDSVAIEQEWPPAGPPGEAERAFRTTHGIRGERPGTGTIEVAWRDERTSLDRDAEIAIELLCDHVAAALRKIERTEPRSAGWLRELRNPVAPRSSDAAVESVDRASRGY